MLLHEPLYRMKKRKNIYNNVVGDYEITKFLKRHLPLKKREFSAKKALAIIYITDNILAMIDDFGDYGQYIIRYSKCKNCTYTFKGSSFV